MFDLKSIEYGTRDRPYRMILCGVEKIGKSTFASQAETPLFIPVRGEEGIDAINCAKTPVITGYSQIMDILQSLYENEHEFKTIVIDSVSTLEMLIWAKVCSDSNVNSIEKIGYGKGYVEALSYWRDITEGLDLLRNDRGLACILIGHVTVKTFNDPLSAPYDQYQLSLHRAAIDLLYRWSDLILFANSKVYVKESGTKNKPLLVGERKLYTQKRPTHPGGGRGIYGHLPHELELDWNAFQSAIKEAQNVI